MFQDNRHYNHLATEGLQELHDQDKETKKDISDRINDELNEVKEDLNYSLTEGEAQQYAGLLNIKPPTGGKPLIKKDKLSDYYKPSKESQEDLTKQQLADAYFFRDHKEKVNITRQRKKYVQQVHNLYTKDENNSSHINWQPVVGSGCYVDGKECYVKFKFKCNYDVNFGVGSVCNIFKTVTFRTPDNRFYTYDHVNHINTIKDYWMKEGDYFGSIDYKAKGYNVAVPEDLAIDFNVKLSDIVPFFDTKNMLVPEVLNNCEISITLEDPFIALVGSGPVPTDLYYQVIDFEIVYDCHYIDTKYIESIHEMDIELKHKYYLTEYKQASGIKQFGLQNDTNNKVFYYVAKKLIPKSDNATHWVTDMMQFYKPSPDESSSYRWTSGINFSPETRENRFENEMHNEKILSPNLRVINMANYYIETLNLSRNRKNNNGIMLDDRNQVTYEYNNFTAPCDLLFVKWMESVTVIEGVPNDYKDEYRIPETEKTE